MEDYLRHPPHPDSRYCHRGNPGNLSSYFGISLFLEQYVGLIVGFILAATFLLIPAKKAKKDYRSTISSLLLFP